jgi:hypothetical protein
MTGGRGLARPRRSRGLQWTFCRAACTRRGSQGGVCRACWSFGQLVLGVLGCDFELLDGNLLEKGLGDVVGGNGTRLGNGAGRRGLLFRHGGGSQACVSR